MEDVFQFLSLACGDVGVIDLAVADGQLLRCVCCNALRHIRHERVNKSDIHNGVNEVLGVQYARVCDNSQTLLVADEPDEPYKVVIPHFLPDMVITQKAAVYCKAGVKRVEALHALHLVNSLTLSVDDACLIKRELSVGPPRRSLRFRSDGYFLCGQRQFCRSACGLLPPRCFRGLR